MARVVLARHARLELLDLDRPVIEAVEDVLGLLEREPDAGYALRGRLRGLLALRVGSFRIIDQRADGGHVVRVAAIRHRSIAYRADPR